MTAPAEQPPRRGRLKTAVVIVLASLMVILGLLVGGVRLLDAFAPQYRNALADRIGQRMDADVQIEGIELGWGWRGPVLYLDDLQVTRVGASAPALTADRLGLAFSISDLLQGKRLPDGLHVDHPQLSLVQQDNGRLGLAHWSRAHDEPMGWDKINALRARIRHIDINDGQIDIDSPRLPDGHVRLSQVSANLQASHSSNASQPATWQLEMAAVGPTWWPKITAHADISGDLPDPQVATVSAHASGLRPLLLARRLAALPQDLSQRLSGGAATLDVKARWADHRLQPSQATMTTTPVHDRRRPDALLPALTAQFNAHSDAQARHIEIALDHLSAPDNETLLPRHQIKAQAMLDTRRHAIQASARNLPGELAARLALLGLPQLARAHVGLAIDSVELQASGNQPMRMAVGFHDLAIDDPQLSAGPIAGRYTQHNGVHELRFNQAGGTLAAARYLNGTLAVSDLGGGIRWQNKADGLHLSIDELRLASREATLTARGTVDLPAKGAPIVDLAADASGPDIARLLARIPQAPDLPNPKLRDWLPKAITAGVLDRGHATIKGPMDRFPFADPRPGEGFHLSLSGHDVDVTYKDDWPPLKKARGTLTLDGETLDLALEKARLLDFAVDTAHAHVDDVREPVMQITGQANHARAKNLLAFLVKSPLRDRFGTLVSALTLTGQDDLSLDLRIPLKPGLGDVKVSGHIDTHDNQLVQSALPGPITDINGRVDFNQQGLTAHDVTGQLLGLPIRVDLAPADGKFQKIVAHAKPALPANRAALAHYLPDDWLDYGQGSTPITVTFKISPDGQVSPITVTSSLAGMAVDLPAPLTKAADTTAPLSAIVNTQANRIHARYNNELRLAIRLANGQPTRIQAVLNEPALAPPDRDGVWIGGQADRVDALGWFAVVRHVLYGDSSQNNSASAKSNSAPSSLSFIGGDMQVEQLALGDRFYPNAHIRAQPMSGVTGWRVNLEGPATQGQFTWTAKPGERMAVAGNLRRLALATEDPAAADAGKPAAASDSSVIWPDVSPMNLPRMQLYVQQFVVDDTDFGQAHADATPLHDGWRLDRLELAGGALTGATHAQWQESRGQTQAHASIDVDGHGLSRLLRSVGYVSPIRSETARIRSQLSIASNPRGLDIGQLNGDVHLALDNGTLLSVDPGAARVLGLFNLYVLPRRLRLDFRDVVDKGMAFDKVRADFNIRQGQAYSDNLTIKTPSAVIGIDGRIGLATRDYDEHVNIAPKLGSGVAIASAVFGGPIVGAAVFAVQELLKKPIRQFSSIGYTLKGSWDDPQITDPSAKQ